MTSTPPSPSSRARQPARDQLGERLLDLMPGLRRRIEEAFPAELRDELSTVTLHQLEALRQLCRSGGMTMAELAHMQGIGLSSATALADRLIRQGLAQRTSDPSDRRVVRVVPNDGAQQLVERFAVAKRHMAAQALAPLDDAEAATLLALLGKIAGGQAAEAPR